MDDNESTLMLELVSEILNAKNDLSLCERFADDSQRELNTARVRLGNALEAHENWFREHIGSIPKVDIV